MSDDKINKCLALTRLIDERAVACLERGEIPFYLSVAGHEAAAVGGAAGLGPADWIFPGYHQLGAAVWRGVPVARLVARILGTAVDPGLGRELPGFHFSSAARIAPATPNLGAHLVQAYGAALAIKLRGASEVVLAYAGSASAATSSYAQVTRRAAERELPLLIIVESPDGSAADAQQIAERIRVAADAARTGRGPQVLRVSQAESTFSGVTTDPELADQVSQAFTEARQAGPPPSGAAFEGVTERPHPVLERQARWFRAIEEASR